MPSIRLIIVIGICFLVVQSLTYLAYRNPQTSTNSPAYYTVVQSGPSHADVHLDAPVYIRRKIWQISKHAPMALDAESQANIKRWDELNPRWRHEVLTDKGSDEYVRDRFAHDSDVVDIYTGLTDSSVRADFFRYLCLYGDGGVYSDIDVEALKPIERWIPQEYQNRTSAVVGIESDTFGLGAGSALLDVQLCNWTLMSKANHRLLEITIRNIVQAIRDLVNKKNVPIEEVTLTPTETLETTGSAQFTRSTWQYLTEVTGEEFTWQKVTGLKQPFFAHDLLILPVTAFANGQTHSEARPPTDPSALVHFQSEGTWKTGSHSWKAMKESEKDDW